MPSRRRIAVVSLALVGLCALGGVAWYAFRVSAAPQPVVAGAPGSAAPGGASAKPGEAGPPSGFAVGVEAVKVETTTLQEEVTAVGTLKSNESVVVRPEIAGRIERIGFRDGEVVSKGDVLVALDAATQKADLQQAKANLALAEANFKRNEDLFDRKFISGRARDESAATLKVQEAAVALAEAKYQKTQIRAPFSGVVGIRNVSVGDYVKEGQDLINLEEIRTLKVDFRLPELTLAQLRQGQSVELATDARPGEMFSATLDAIDPLVDASGRSILLRARLANPEGKLRPGMFARVRLILGERRDVLTVPEEALVPRGDDQLVYRVTEGKAQQVRVKTGLRRQAKVEIVEGLKAGDLVVTAGQLKLRDGAPVTVAQPGVAAHQAGEEQGTQRTQRE